MEATSNLFFDRIVCIGEVVGAAAISLVCFLKQKKKFKSCSVLSLAAWLAPLFFKNQTFMDRNSSHGSPKEKERADSKGERPSSPPSRVDALRAEDDDVCNSIILLFWTELLVFIIII